MRAALLLALSCLAACTRGTIDTATNDAAPAAAASKPTASATTPDLDVDEIMIHVMDPAARQFWAGWGETYSAEGAIDISAKTDEDWEKVQDGATTVILTTNMLMTPAYQREPKDKWIQYARKVADLAMAGRQGADKHDKKAMEDIGGRLNTACNACHKAFRRN